jgi:hypothetical protein
VKRLPPYLHVTPRIDQDIDDCVAFVARQPWGKPNDRTLDIRRGIERALALPEANHGEVWRSTPGFWPPSGGSARGVVSIRAVRHSRVKDVFSGVKEPTTAHLLSLGQGFPRHGDHRSVLPSRNTEVGC